MKIAVTGAGGLVGSALVPALESDGHTVLRLVRRRDQVGPNRLFWDPATGEIDASMASQAEAVIHLAGDGIAQGRWTAAKKERIRQSRVDGTQLIARAVASEGSRVKTFISASAIGFYGNRGEEWLNESSSRGVGFLSEVCEEWERATRPAHDAGIRTIQARLGVVLSAKGGALGQMLFPFRLGLGGVVGDGSQYMSWIALADLVNGLRALLGEATASGPINLVAPFPVRQREFAATLAAVLHRPAFLPMPAWVLRVLFGEMADAALLSSTRVEPAQLKRMGYVFQYPSLRPALDALLK